MKRRNNKGFTLTEILVAVAILVISFSIIGVNAAEIRDELNQFKANAIARQIFVNAQDQVTRIKVSGNDKTLTKQNDFDYDPETYTGTNRLKYIYSTDEDIDLFCAPDDFEGSYVIEYDATYGHVYGVFYSTEELESYTTTEEDDKWRHTTLDTFYTFAKENGYNVAYYGGEVMNATIPEPEPEDKPSEDPEDDNDRISLEHDGFVYWEIYTDNTYGVYYVYDFTEARAHCKDQLNYGKVVVEDGYGVAIGKDTGTYLYVDRKCTAATAICYHDGTFSDLESNTGYLFKFPKAWYDEVEDANSAFFYARLGFWVFDSFKQPSSLINPEPIYTNMRMAKNGVYVGKGNTNTIYDNAAITGSLYIRSARQLYDLSLYYNLWAIGAEGVQVIQDTNIDYVTYHWSQCSLVTNAIPSQYPIGTNAFTSKESKGTCMLNYDGKGYTINGLTIKAANNYCGLFSRLRDYPYRRDGKVVDSGIVENVNLTFVSLENATYKGAIAGYVEKNAKILNCTTSSSNLYGSKASGAVIE